MPESHSHAATHQRRDALTGAAAFFLAANLIHTADHIRQGLEGVTTEVLVGGSTVTVMALIALVLAARRHPRAALFAAFAGFSAAAGIAASHIAPHWSALSDSYPEIHADALSWVIMLLEVSSGLTLGVVGARILRRDSPGPAASPATP